MIDKIIKRNLFSRLKYFSWFLIILWTGCIVASLLWNFHEQEEKVLNIAHNSAQVIFENDVIYRRWVATKGGVYVPISEHTPPNPYLNVPNRDISTSSGLALTLVNPAYMTRQVNQMAEGIQGSKGHLTSLKPIRPENAPDPWETSALKAFEQGAKEISSVEEMDGGVYMRLMRPFFAEKPCLKCHAVQGYKEGDIRGGISVSIPMAPLRAIEGHQLTGISLAHGALWIIGMAGIVISRRGLGKQILARERVTSKLQRLNRTLEQRVQNRTEELMRSQQRLQQLASQLLMAQEKERKRVAVELHDGLLSELAATKYLLEGKMMLLRNGELSDPIEFKKVTDILAKVIKETRGIMNNLRPSILDELGLLATIKWLSEEYQEAYPQIKVEKQVEISEQDLSDSVKVVIFRVLQEALNNFAKHGKGDRVDLSLSKNDNTIALGIRDNGQGFDVDKKQKGLGLESMRERVELSGGHFQIESVIGQGTTIQAKWSNSQ
jgi:signal transduction histidine kinase